MILFSNIHLIILSLFVGFLLKTFKENKDHLIIFIVLFFYSTNDLFRLIGNTSFSSNFILVSKDILLLSVLLFNLNIFLDYFKKLNKFQLYLLTSLIFLISINFFLTDEKILFIPGIYDIFFFPVILIFLVSRELDYKKLFIIFEFISIIIILIFILQVFYKEFYINFLMNNINIEVINKLFQEKSYNPKLIIYNDLLHLNLYSSIFNNPGRLNHLIPCLFLIMNFFYIVKVKKLKSLAYMIILFIIVVINSSRFSIILCMMPILFLLFTNILKKKYFKSILFISLSTALLYLLSFNYFHKIHFKKIDHNTSSNKFTLIIYHNFYEPVISSYDGQRKNTASAITGRLKMIDRQLNHHFIARNNSFNLKSFLFGNGIGKHSMSLKIIKDENSYIYEVSLIVLLYEYGILLMLTIFGIYLFFLKTIFYYKNNINNNLVNFFQIISAYPFLLLLTGYQFYRDYAFQFFFFFLLGLVVNFIVKKKGNENKF